MTRSPVPYPFSLATAFSLSPRLMALPPEDQPVPPITTISGDLSCAHRAPASKSHIPYFIGSIIIAASEGVCPEDGGTRQYGGLELWASGLRDGRAGRPVLSGNAEFA